MVSQKEIIEALRLLSSWRDTAPDEKRFALANRIKSEGIAPPDGFRLVPWQTLDGACELLELHGEHEHPDYKALKATTSAKVKPCLPPCRKGCPMNNDQNNLLKRINAALYDDADPYQALRDCRAEIERLSKPYVPMTKDELHNWFFCIAITGEKTVQHMEIAVIKRAGLDIKHD